MRDEFLKWLGTKPSGRAHEFAWEAWKAATLLEREACAKVCDVIDDGHGAMAAGCADAIRARGQQ